MTNLNYESCCDGHAVFGSVNHSNECKVATIKDVDLAIKRQRVFKEAEINLNWLEKETKKFEVKCSQCGEAIGDKTWFLNDDELPLCESCNEALTWYYEDVIQNMYIEEARG